MEWMPVVYALDLDTGEWRRELEGYLVPYEVRRNTYNKIWIDFVSAAPDRKIVGNVDILTEEWTEGQNFPHKENGVAWPWLTLLIIPGALLVYFVRKSRKSQA